MKYCMAKYKSYGVYRFLDVYKNIVYIGMSDDINRRMTKEHFTKNGHLKKRGKSYKDVAMVELIKLNDPGITAGLERYLIDKYLPSWNKAGKRNEFDKVDYQDEKLYESHEHWKPYIYIKPFDEDKIKLNKFQGKLAIALAYGMFISILVFMAM